MMDAANYWELFSKTGAPELYMLYRAAQEETSCKTENR